MARPRRAISDLDVTAQFWWTTDQLGARWHISEKRVRELLVPHRGQCHLGRRGRHPRLCWWVPLPIVQRLDRERMDQMTRTTLRTKAS